MKQMSVEGSYAYILWTAETAENLYEMGTDTFVVSDGKIVAGLVGLTQLLKKDHIDERG